ncbi:MAG: solute carrier family 23 protein [Bacillota bacterium]|nr:solute carrier family 23 protein [Bacillota bacterium]
MSPSPITEGVTGVGKLTPQKALILGIQHAFTMFGATVLVPILTGMDISVALFMAGAGTLLFHLLTKGKIPAFLGSSFAFIIPVQVVAATEGLPYAQGGIVISGLVYLIVAVLIHFYGTERIMSYFPPVVTGPIIMVIGLKLAPSAIANASDDWFLACIVFAIVAALSVYARGFLRVVPVIVGLISAYLIAMFLNRVDFTAIKEAKWVAVPAFTLAKFSLQSIITVAPLALVTMIEHIGDVVAIGATVKQDFSKDPGLSRTLLGDGLATCLSAMFGGPANTTYSENTGVLVLTGVWNPLIMRIAAVIAIILGFMPKIGAVIQSIPVGIIGGVSILLFGMISAVGIRTLVENQVDFSQPRNLIIAAVILVLGLGGASLPLQFGQVSLTLEGMGLAAIAGIILNLVFKKSDIR